MCRIDQTNGSDCELKPDIPNLEQSAAETEKHEECASLLEDGWLAPTQRRILLTLRPLRRKQMFRHHLDQFLTPSLTESRSSIEAA